MHDDVSPEQEQNLRSLVERVDVSAGWAHRQSPDLHLASLEARLGASATAAPARGSVPSRHSPRTGARIGGQPFPIWRRLAIGAGLAAAVAGFWVLATPNHPEQSVIGTPTAMTYATQPGERATVTLDDGSRVTLAPDTRAIVNGRDVRLYGEALFSVVSDANVPFVVTANDTRTTVLGTTFAIRAYPGDSQVRVAVTEGRVQVAATQADGPQQDDTRILNASDAVVVAGNAITSLSSVDLSAVLGWVQGKLVWDRAAAEDVVRDINRTYGVHIELSTPKLRAREITAVFPQMPMSDVLDELGLLLNARYMHNGATIVFTPR